ncbi:MAG TPA: hypothetical protein VGN89_08685, partial [Phenylobacterium sp.]|nr:hypothetical protein [Phenylobacterium sp.]
MLAEILALLAAAAPALAQATAPAAPTHTVSGLTVPAPGKPPPPDAVVDVAGDADRAGRDFIAIWPGTAYQAGA